MNYLSLIKGLVAEATSMKQYKKLKSPFGVLAFIGVFPMIVSSVFSILLYVGMCFFYNGISSGIQFLEKWVDEKKKGVNHATEAVLFFVTMPTIFCFNVFLSFFALFFYLVWFSIQVNTYLATLGGTRWQPFIMDATFDGENDLEPCGNEGHKQFFSVVAFVLYVLSVVLMILAMSEGDEYAIFSMLVSSVHNLIVLIGVPITFKKKPAAPVSCESATSQANDGVISEQPVSAFKEAGTKEDTQAYEETF